MISVATLPKYISVGVIIEMIIYIALIKKLYIKMMLPTYTLPYRDIYNFHFITCYKRIFKTLNFLRIKSKIIKIHDIRDVFERRYIH